MITLVETPLYRRPYVRRHMPSLLAYNGQLGVLLETNKGLVASSQTWAIQSYRSRLGDRGLARFEVLGRDSDRSLIRFLARPEAANLRTVVSKTLAGEPPKKGGILAALRLACSPE